MHVKYLVSVSVFLMWAPGLALAEPDIVAVPLSNADHRFRLVDNPALEDNLKVTKVFRDYDAVCAINGGFFDENFEAVGYYKVGGKVLSPDISPGLSGHVCIDREAKLSLHFQTIDPDEFVSVFQAGPLLVDPGGRPGIKRDDGKVADRSAIVQLADGTLVFLYHAKSTLYALSQYILAEYPTVERAINLDGGPEAGIATAIPSPKIRENTMPSKSYVVVMERRAVADTASAAHNSSSPP